MKTSEEMYENLLQRRSRYYSQKNDKRGKRTKSVAFIFSILIAGALSTVTIIDVANSKKSGGADVGGGDTKPVLHGALNYDQTADPADSLDTDPTGGGEPETIDTHDSDALPQGWDVGGTGGCMVHGDGYHFFPGRLTEYVGEDRFDEWFEEVEKDYVYTTTDCPCKSSNLYEFIKYFNVPKEATINAYNENTRYYYLCTLDIDLLYDGTAEENDQFYRETFNDYAERYRKINFFSMKGTLLQRNKKFIDSYLNESVNIDNISIIEIIYAANITREQMEANIDEANSMMPNDGLKNAYDYDLDLIYEQREYVESLINDHSSFYMDLLFCGLEPRENPYEK